MLLKAVKTLLIKVIGETTVFVNDCSWKGKAKLNVKVALNVTGSSEYISTLKGVLCAL